MTRQKENNCPSCGDRNRNEVALVGSNEPIGLLCCSCGYTEPLAENGFVERASAEDHPLQRVLKELRGKEYRSSQALVLASVLEQTIEYLFCKFPDR